MTVIAKPNKMTRVEKIKASSTCDSYIPSKHDRMNTVFKCSICPQLWVARPSTVPFIWFEGKWAPRKLRWYHWANRHLDKEVAA